VTTAAPFSSFPNTSNLSNQQSATSIPFAAPSQPTQANPFGQQPATSIPFGAPSQLAQANPFGQPSGQSRNPFGGQNPPAQPNPFGSTAATPFGAPSHAPKNPFGTQPTNTSSQPNPFGATPAATNPFGNPSSNQANPLSRPTSSGTGAFNGNTGFSNGTGSSSNPLFDAPSVDPNGRLINWHGKRVVYKDGVPGTEKQGDFKNGRREIIWERIWFPKGPPEVNLDTEVIDKSVYEDEKLKEAYMSAIQTGSFPGGIMPLIPPKREWCNWDF
jgi:nucleoporin NUP42